MITSVVRVLAGFAAGVAMLLAPVLSVAQSDYPNRPVRIVVGFPPGGSNDIVGRIVALKLGERLGQQVIVDNRSGAGGTIGADIAAKAAPDGYTLTVGTTSTHAVAASTYSKLPYDPVRHFAPISLVAITPHLLVINLQVPANTLAEFVTLARNQPGKLNYGTAGYGSTAHLAMEMLKDAAKIDLVHVPYKGNAPADLAILSNEVQAVFASMPAMLQNVKANKVRALAVGTARRSPALPEVATVAELGFPGFQSALWLGILAPAGTPQPVIERLSRELNAMVATPDFRTLMDKTGAEPISNTPEQFAAMIRADVDRYARVVKAVGVKLD